MLGTIIQKELKAISLSPKFIATFIVCSFLLLVSVMIGISEYRQAVAQYEAVNQLADERLNQTATWHGVSEREHRRPSPLQIFASGLTYDIGRWSDIDAESTVKLKHSIYSDDPIFAVFRILDFTFIVQIVFSLLALLFTYDAINGEKESGTLRLVFSNALSRTTYIIGKAIGSWLGLMVPVLIPILLSLLLVVLFGIPINGGEWVKLSLLIGVSLLYMTFFIVFGLLVSTLSRRTNISFLFSLVFWIAFVLIIPRGGVVAAGHILPVPGLGEIEGIRDAYAKNKWEDFYQESEKRWRAQEDAARTAEEDGTAEEPDDADIWARMQEEHQRRKEVQQEIENQEALLMEDWHNKQRAQQRLGFILSRISPAATYQLAATTLAGTDITLKSMYESAFKEYRNDFNAYVDKKSENAGPGAGAIMITVDSEKGFDLSAGRENAVDVSDRPLFVHPEVPLSTVINEVLMNTSFLLFMTLLVLIAVYAKFLRFDLR